MLLPSFIIKGKLILGLGRLISFTYFNKKELKLLIVEGKLQFVFTKYLFCFLSFLIIIFLFLNNPF